MRHLRNFQSATQNSLDVRASDKADVEAFQMLGLGEDAEESAAKLAPVRSPQADASARLGQSATPHDLAKLKRIKRERHKRARYFGDDLFADPAWDILMNLAIAEIEQRRVTISELCLAAGAPASTALRWITNLTKDGVLARRPDVFDRRRVYIEFTTSTSIKMRSYLADIRYS